MKLILLQKVVNLGSLGDKVDVKPGYGRNYLVPFGKAVPATATNIATFEAKRAEYEAKANSILADAEARKAKLDGATADFTLGINRRLTATVRRARLFGNEHRRNMRGLDGHDDFTHEFVSCRFVLRFLYRDSRLALSSIKPGKQH